MLKKLEDRSRRSQEAHSEVLLKISQSIYAALFLAIVTVPINILINFYLRSWPNSPSFGEVVGNTLAWIFPGLLVLLSLAFIFGWVFERRALITFDKYFTEDKHAEQKEKFRAKPNP